MISKSQIKLIRSLKQKKYRYQHQIFVVEGVKSVTEFLGSSFELVELFCTEYCFEGYHIQSTLISPSELQAVSGLSSPNKVLAIFRMPVSRSIDWNQLVVGLDQINDPGNLGTIIRLCDWFGIQDLVCDNGTVDCYNSKVVQSTMGSLTRVNVTYLELKSVVESRSGSMGTFTDGNSIYDANLPQKGLLVMGNEANGISDTIAKNMDYRLSIPRYGQLQQTESLNVANALAVTLAEFKRQSIGK